LRTNTTRTPSRTTLGYATLAFAFPYGTDRVGARSVIWNFARSIVRCSGKYNVTS